MTIVVLGDLMTDVVVRLREPVAPGSDAAASTVLRGGGSAANLACWLAAAGHAVTFVGRVGADDLGAARVTELAAYGVRPVVAIDPQRPTGTCVVLVGRDGERTMLPDRGANLALGPADVPETELRAAAHLHVSGYALLDPGPRAPARQALTLARRAGVPTSVDASSAAPLQAVGAQRFAGWAAAGLLFANAAEAGLLELAGWPDVVVKRGAAGAEWWHRGRRVARVPAEPAVVVDTTGAGDAFAAGVLAARLGGRGRAAALAEGARLAAACVSRPGGRPG